MSGIYLFVFTRDKFCDTEEGKHERFRSGIIIYTAKIVTRMNGRVMGKDKADREQKV